jgi:plastocyanin
MLKNLKQFLMKTLFAGLAVTALILAGCSKNEPGKDEVFISMNSFSPTSLTVAVGTTIVWQNQDAVNHTVTSNTGVFDSGNMGKNDKFLYTFATAGTYPYHCKIHSGMTGTIIVE